MFHLLLGFERFLIVHQNSLKNPLMSSDSWLNFQLCDQSLENFFSFLAAGVLFIQFSCSDFCFLFVFISFSTFPVFVSVPAKLCILGVKPASSLIKQCIFCLAGFPPVVPPQNPSGLLSFLPIQ